MTLSAEDLVVLALDRSDTERGYYYFHAKTSEAATRFTSASELPDAPRVVIALFATKTYSEGMGGGSAERSPEDRALTRSISSRFAGRTAVVLMSGSNRTSDGGPKGLVEFKPEMLRQAPELLRECWTVPNRQDYTYLATKTFGLNLVVRVFFMILPVRNGGLNLLRAAAALTWYQFQDTIFTVFGQTYMKFLGRMTGMLRLGPVRFRGETVGPLYLGDFTFVYVQLCFSEFLNRLVLGPIGVNPLVYTWQGMGLIFLNIIQGMLSGGPLTPAINKMRRAGVISHSTMMHLYQIASLSMQFGLLATFGYQLEYALLTVGTFALSWGSYAIFSLLYQDPASETADPEMITRLENLAKLAHAR